MTLTAIILISLALIFFILTRTTYVYIKYEKEFSLEFHFVIFSFTQKFNKKSKNKGPAPLFYTSLIRHLNKLLNVSEVKVMQVCISPSSKTDSYERLFPIPYGIGALFSAIFAYFKQNTKKITIEDNAVILTPSSTETKIEFRLYTELYNLLILLIKVTFDLIKYRKKRKLSNVGN